MAHGFEPAPTGRAKCRGCGTPIPKDSVRFGERHPNPYGEGEMVLWFHPICAAHKRPETLLEGLEAAQTPPEDVGTLRSLAEVGAAHRRLPRVDGASRAPTGRARCRHCREMIPKDSWRIHLVYWEEGRFEPSGFLHAPCGAAYFEHDDLLDRILHFTPLEEADRAALEQALG